MPLNANVAPVPRLADAADPPSRASDPSLSTLKELDQRCGQPKGAAFRAFKRLREGWSEGVDFHCCDSRTDPAAFALLQASGRLHPRTVNAVLLTEAAARAIEQVVRNEHPG